MEGASLSKIFTVELDGKRLILDGVPVTESNITTSLKDLLLNRVEKPEAVELLKLSPGQFKNTAKKLFRDTYQEVNPVELPKDIPVIDSVTGVIKIINLVGVEKDNPTLDEVLSNEHPTAYFHGLPNKQIAEEMKYNMPKCRFLYDPYNPKVKYYEDIGGRSLLHINTYRKPAWMLVDPIEDEKPWELFQKLMTHLIPNQEHRDFTYVWIHRAIFQRNLTFLMLRGIRANGKTTLLQLIAALAGTATKAQEDFFTTTFNSQLKDARFVYKDEGDLDKHANTRLKSYLNQKVAIQAKHVDVAADTEVFASFAMAQNLEDRNYHLQDERKKSQPDLTEVKLDKILKKNTLHYLNEVLPKEPSHLAVIGNHIREDYHPDNFSWSNTDPLKGEQYWRDVITSQPPFYKVLIEKLLSREADKYSTHDIQKVADSTEKLGAPKRTQPPGKDRLIAWAKSFHWKDEDEPLCTMELLEDDDGRSRWYAIPNDEYLP